MTAQPANEEPVVIRFLDGRVFRAATKTTFKQDIYLMNLLAGTTIMEIAGQFDPQTMEMNDFAQAVIRSAYESGNLFRILAGSLTEDGVPWTVAGAEATARYFEDLDDPADKAQLHGPLASVVLNFFLSAVESERTSPKFSSHSDAKTLAKRSISEAQRHATRLHDTPMANSEEARTTASGTTSSEHSPNTIPTPTNE